MSAVVAFSRSGLFMQNGGSVWDFPDIVANVKPNQDQSKGHSHTNCFAQKIVSDLSKITTPYSSHPTFGRHT